jgi:hypothetical protein
VRLGWIALLAVMYASQAAASTSEAEFGAPDSGDCVSGDCTNGIGTLRYANGTEVRGRRVGGKQVAGPYEIRWPCQPDRTFTLTYDEGNFPVSGTVVRSCRQDAMRLSAPPGRITTFTGTFATLTNPFTREQISSFKTGTYADGEGVLWEGEFEYIPVRASVVLPGYGKTFLRSGAFVFLGVKIDQELDEVVRGLYISPPTVPGEEIRLIRARPDYLRALQATFVSDRGENAGELAAEARASREMFSTIANIVVGAAVAYGSYKALAAADRSTLESITSVLKGSKSASRASSELTESTPKAASGSGRPLTIAEYRQQMAAPGQTAVPTAGPSVTPSSGSVGGQPSASGSESNKATEQQRRDQEAQQREERRRQDQVAQQDRTREEDAKRQRHAKEKADLLAKQRAELAGEQQTQRDYLNALIQGVRLTATTCLGGEGKYFVTGTMPKLKEVLSCVDVHYEASCPRVAQTIPGIAKTFVGLKGCFGDTYPIDPKPACNVAEVSIRVTDVRPGCK